MVSNNLNPSLVNSMHRHPQMVWNTVYFAGQSADNSSNTYLRWLGTTWENAHASWMGSDDLPDNIKPWNRKFLPVCLANGGAGRYSIWEDYPDAAKTTSGGASQQGNVPRNIHHGMPDSDVGWDNVYNSTTRHSLKHGYYDFTPDEPLGITGSNVNREDNWLGNYYRWPQGEYKSTIPADYLDLYQEGLENFIGGTIWPVGSMTGITVDMELVPSSSSIAYRDIGPAIDTEQVWNYENYQNGVYPFWFDGHMIYYGTPSGQYPNSVRLEYTPSNLAGDDRTAIINALGYDVDALTDEDTVTMVVQADLPPPQIPKVFVAKISDCLDYSDDFGWNWDHFSPNLPNTHDGWSSSGNHPDDPIWGDNPQITFKFNHSMPGFDGVTYDNYTPQMEKTLRTPTRTVLLYELSDIIPAGAPIGKVELVLTTKGRWNWPTDEGHHEVHDGIDGSHGSTVARNHKIWRGQDYQLTMLHPATNKYATWKTYNGINPWSELISDDQFGATCAYLPHVMNYGAGNDQTNNSATTEWGLGWKDGTPHGFPNAGVSADWDARGNYTNWELGDSRRKWFGFVGPADGQGGDNMGLYEAPTYLEAVLSPLPEEIVGISGGGVLVRPNSDESQDGFKLGLPGHKVGITQGEVFELTGRRYKDTIDFKFEDYTGNGSRERIDITNFAIHAINNYSGKLRLALSGKFFNGAPPGGTDTSATHQDKFKTEASWSHNAYWGGLTGGDHDDEHWNMAGGITHPFYGEHTIKTEFIH